MDTLTIDTIKKLRAEIARRQAMAIAQANRDADRGNNALDVVEALLREAGDRGAIAETPVTRSLEFGGNGNGAPVHTDKEPRKIYPTGRWIAEIIDGLPSIVTQPDIYKQLIEKHPEVRARPVNSIKGQIASVLGKLVEKGQLIVRKEAHGTTPAEYRKRTVTEEVPVKIPLAAVSGIQDVVK